MPTKRLSMRRIRELLRLKYAQGLSERLISDALGISKGAVGGYLSRARAAGLSWPLPEELDDDALELLLFPGDLSPISPPVYGRVRRLICGLRRPRFPVRLLRRTRPGIDCREQNEGGSGCSPPSMRRWR